MFGSGFLRFPADSLTKGHPRLGRWLAQRGAWGGGSRNPL